uniref:NADPH-dependent diflavin oxidoreductase 1 n=1 Tax=Globodera rostochiensis TaxID=31243 RepID=A0A914HET1_GLORO
MIILYGSESGTGQDFAEQIWLELRNDNTKVSVKCMSFDDYQISNLCDETIAIFVVATSGQGEAPTNMRNNWRNLLSRKLGSEWLSNLNFSVLALGDSSYQKYNFAGKKLYRRLLQLGAASLMELALADEQHTLGVDEVFEKWLPELLSLVKNYSSPNLDGNSQIMSRRFLVEFAPFDLPPSSKFLPISVIGNERLTDPNHFQETRLITLSLGQFESALSYSPGDVLMVLPENLPKSVEIAVNALVHCKSLLEEPFHICRTDVDVPFRPQFARFFSSAPITLLDCLNFYFDLQSIPKRFFLRQLAKCSSDPLEKERLMELSSDMGIEDYLAYCHFPRRTIAELLRDFPKTSSCLKPTEMFEFFPVIRPRAFSIASSPQAHPGIIQILVAKVMYSVKKMAFPRFGLCSNFLCTRKIGDELRVRIRPGLFKYGKGGGPLLLIGPGTGVAPHRSIVAENESSVGPFAPITLFFGCRGAQRDFYFKDEWPNYARTNLIPAFSRDQKEKIYVQHKILEHSMEVCRFLEHDDCRIFIAGSAGDMPPAVVSALKEVMRKTRHLTESATDDYFEGMERSGRIVYETWS